MARHSRVVWGTAATDPLVLTRDRVRRLQQLCHPDRHPGSALAVEVSQWLVEVGRELDSKERSKR